MQFAGLFAALESQVNLRPSVHYEELRAPLGEDAVLDQPLTFTLARLSLLKETGRLEIILASGETMEITLIEGVVQTWKSFSRTESSMALELMAERKMFTPEVLETLAKESESLKRNALHVLMGRGDMRPTEAVQIIRSIYREYLKTALSSPEGSLVFNQKKPEDVKAGPVPTPLHGLNLSVMAEMVVGWNIEDRTRLTQLLNHHKIELQQPHIELLNKWLGKWAICSPKVLRILEGGENWESILALEDHKIEVGLSIAFLIGAAAVEECEVVTVKTPLRLKSEKIVSELRSADLYERLELHWTAHPNDVINSYSSRLTDLENRLDTDLLPTVRELLGEAKSGLATEEARIAYRHETYGKRLIRDRSDFLLQQVRRNCMRNEWVEALRSLEALVDMGIRTAEVLDLMDSAKTRLR